jgi:hypothetical protein
MKSRILTALLLPVVTAAILWPSTASAIPVFARKYGVNCTMCHSNMPRLNDFGMRYRNNGYRLPSREDADKTVLESPAPVALRTSAGYIGQAFNESYEAPDVSDFRVHGLDLLSGGMLGRNISYFMVYLPQIYSGQINSGRGVDYQQGSLEMASVVFSNLCRSPWLNLRVGRFEPAYVAFSVKRQLSVSPYEIYDMSFPDGMVFSETQSGIELSGHGRSPLRYAAGIVGGSGGGKYRSFDSPSDVYARASYVFGAGEGQTAGQRIGVIGYLGRARRYYFSSPRAGFFRIGADASLNASFVNVAAQFLYAMDCRTLWSQYNAEDNVTYWGGFGEVTIMPIVDFVGFARLDFVDAPKVSDHDVTRVTAGGRYYFEDNVALHAEYSFRTTKSLVEGVDDYTESFVAARVDFAF